ncbi:hypothetical protein R1T40_08545 [Tritonibacter scottomollicae]|uniref:Uncharacterized protein n=1 Tax=Tritonibacter scottomollicae TaxID=483013 RepID=A0ABZ0HKT7_TRISK|nr:hypothetical protein [Tritonibacter scottomollicae]WOI34759.1 hypothetical protein R1T40_08545 [Tritonibacter scottomollicae]
MDSAEQAYGEKRVRALLIEPLLARGLTKPKGFTKQADFEVMVAKVLCPKLAYMTELSLAALEEEVAANPKGKGRDQMMIPNEILERAAKIQPPAAEASPLMRAVFAAALGRDAMAGNWGPELLRFLRKNRAWPSALNIQGIKAESELALRRVEDIRQRQASGRLVSEADQKWFASRNAAQRKCEEIRELVSGGTAC